MNNEHTPMEQLLQEYQASRAILATRLTELEGQQKKARGEEALLLMKRISILKDEIFCMGRAMDGIARNLSD